MKMLLDRGADIDASKNLGQSAFHWAVGTGHRSVMEILMDCGATINARNGTILKSFSGITTVCEEAWMPLDLAGYHGDEPMVRTLLDHGARNNTRTGAKTLFILASLVLLHFKITCQLQGDSATIDKGRRRFEIEGR